MSDRRDPTRDQALPCVNDNPYIQDLVIADIVERKDHGINKYGTALQAGNGRDALRDLYEELLDGVMYVRQAMEERDANATALVQLRALVANPRARFVTAKQLRAVLDTAP